MVWKNININKQNIKADTGRSILIQMPHSSDYDGYCFWHSSKLVHDGRHSNAVSIGYTDDFNFRLIKYGKGKWNSSDVIDEIYINASQFEEAFGVMNENIKAPDNVNIYETHKPTEKQPVKAEVLEELKDE